MFENSNISVQSEHKSARLSRMFIYSSWILMEQLLQDVSTFSVNLHINFLEQHEEWNEKIQNDIKLNSFISSGHSCI